VVLESWSWVGWFTVWLGYLGLGREHTCLYEFYALGNGIGRPAGVCVCNFIMAWDHGNCIFSCQTTTRCCVGLTESLTLCHIWRPSCSTLDGFWRTVTVSRNLECKQPRGKVAYLKPEGQTACLPFPLGFLHH
jgi:hypothetical protein